MVDFNDVRRESEPTFFFFARPLRTAFEYALKECQITGWQIMTRKEALKYLPEDFVIPEVRISPDAPRIEKSVRVFVSHYNLNDVARKAFNFEKLHKVYCIVLMENSPSEFHGTNCYVHRRRPYFDSVL